MEIWGVNITAFWWHVLISHSLKSVRKIVRCCGVAVCVGNRTRCAQRAADERGLPHLSCPLPPELTGYWKHKHGPGVCVVWARHYWLVHSPLSLGFHLLTSQRCTGDSFAYGLSAEMSLVWRSSPLAKHSSRGCACVVKRRWSCKSVAEPLLSSAELQDGKGRDLCLLQSCGL